MTYTKNKYNEKEYQVRFLVARKSLLVIVVVNKYTDLAFLYLAFLCFKCPSSGFY